MADDREIFDKAESDMRLLQSRLQLTSPELLTIFLLIIAKDLTVPLPGTFDGIATNYAAILNPDGGGLNDEKLAINTYLGRVGTDLATFQYVLLTKIAAARAIANIQAAIPTPLPAAPYIPPAPKRPNPPPVLGLAVSLSAATTGTVGTAIALSATVAVPQGRAVTKVEFYEGNTEGNTKLGEDTSAPYTFSYTPGSIGNKSITARAFDNSPSPVVSVSNAITIVVSAPSVPVPTITVSAPKAGLINEAMTVTAAASVTGDTIASVQFQVDGANSGAADTSSPYSTSITRTGKGTIAVRAIATGVQGGTAISSAVNIPVFDTKLDPSVNGGAGAGCSLGAETGNFILFDNNQAGGGLAATMAINVGGVQVGAFNYTDAAYNGRPFAFFYQGQFYTDTIKSTVNF